MNITLEPWQIITLAGAILSFIVSALAKVTQSRLEASFNDRRQAAADERKVNNDRLTTLEERSQTAERDLLTLKAELPLHYVRAEDYIRNQTRLEGKLDALATTLQNTYLKGTPHA